jgi:hypothetical protein
MTAASDEPTLDLDQVRAWLKHFSAGEGLLSISSTGNWNGRAFSDAAAATDYVHREHQAGREGIYLRGTTLRERPPAGRGGADLSHAFFGLWSDLDIAGPGHKNTPKPLPPDEGTARAVVAASGLPEPTTWIWSGGGMYAWWFMPAPHIIGDDRAEIEELSVRWQAALGRSADQMGYHYGTGVSDLARVLRIPGTVNKKAGLERPCMVVTDDGPTYTLGELCEAAPPIPAPPSPAPQTAVSPDQDQFWKQFAQPHDGPGPFTALGEYATTAGPGFLLEPRGWTSPGAYKGPGGGQIWNRPGGSSGLSAIWEGYGVPNLVVFSTDAGLPSGEDQDLTAGKLFCWLTYGGYDSGLASTAGRELRKAAAGDPAASTAARQLPGPVLNHIRAVCNVTPWHPSTLPSATSPAGQSSGDPLAAQLETVLAAIRDYKDEHGDLGLTEKAHKTYGTEYRFRCPAHTDEILSPISAAVARTKTKVTLYCNRKCGPVAILSALGIPGALEHVPATQIPGVDEDDPRPRLDVTDEVTAVEGTVEMICARVIPNTYVRAGTLVVISEARGKVTVTDVGEDRLRALLTEHAVTYRDTPRGKARALPSVTTCRAILARENWPGVPELIGVVSTPVLRPDGTVLQAPGYDTATKLYLHRRVEVPNVPDQPSPVLISAALDLLLNRMLIDFPWVSDADKANYLAAVFTQILRPHIGGLSPLIDLTAPERGSGKTLLADLIRHLFGADMRPWPEHDAEMRKSITAALRETQPAVIFDNVPARSVVEYPSLAMVLTNPEWTDRVLGRTKQISLPNDRLWMVTGTNVRVGGDLAQRTLLVRIDPNQPRPDLRTDFVIPDLEGWVQEHRGQVLHALLTLARAWIAAGAPRADFAMRGFTRWACALGGLLAFHGMKGFLGNRQEIEPYDEDAEIWSAFLSAWHARFGDEAVSAKDLLAGVDNWGAGDDWSTVFPRVGDGDGAAPSVKLFQRMLKERSGRWYGPFAVRGRQDGHSKTWVWWVAEMGSQGGLEGGTSETPPTSSDQGTVAEGEAGKTTRVARDGGISGADSADVADVADDPQPNVLAHTPPPPFGVGGGGVCHVGRSVEPPQRPQRPQDRLTGGPPLRPSQPIIEDTDAGSDDTPDPLDDEPYEETA